jgi:hypothetical protein
MEPRDRAQSIDAGRQIKIIGLNYDRLTSAYQPLILERGYLQMRCHGLALACHSQFTLNIQNHSFTSLGGQGLLHDLSRESHAGILPHIPEQRPHTLIAYTNAAIDASEVDLQAHAPLCVQPAFETLELHGLDDSANTSCSSLGGVEAQHRVVRQDPQRLDRGLSHDSAGPTPKGCSKHKNRCNCAQQTMKKRWFHIDLLVGDGKKWRQNPDPVILSWYHTLERSAACWDYCCLAPSDKRRPREMA